MKRLVLLLVSATLLLASAAQAYPVTHIVRTTTYVHRFTLGHWNCTVGGYAGPSRHRTTVAVVYFNGMKCRWVPLHQWWARGRSWTRSWTTPCRMVGYVSGGRAPGSAVVIHLGDSCGGFGGPQIVKRIP